MANSQLLQQLEQGTAPLAMRMAIADGLMPIEGDELVIALGLLTKDPSQKVRTALRTNLPEMPRGFLVSTAAMQSASPDLLYFIAQVLIKDEEIIQPLILNRSVDDRTLVFVAENGPPSSLEILAQNRNRMLESPVILKKLLENEQLSRVSRYALEEFRERFNIDTDVMDTDIDVPTAETSVSPTRATQETAQQSISESKLAVEEIVTQVLDQDDSEVITDELAPEIDPELRNLLTEELSGSEADSISVEELDQLEEIDLESESEPGDDKFEEHVQQTSSDGVKGVNDGWDIDTLVKEVGGAASDADKFDSFGFDDILDMNLVGDDESASASAEWMGEDISELARKHGIRIEDEDDEDESGEKVKITDTRIRMMKMSAADKLLIAKMGTKQERAILVMDPNKKVAIAVVEGPKMSEFEIQMIASNRQVYEEVLRAIAQHRKWGKSPSVRRELVLNPKTPLDLSVRMLSSLNDFILKDVTKSKEIPSALAIQAKRVLDIRDKRRQ